MKSGSILCNFDCDGTTIVLTFSDGSMRKVKKISADEAKNYKSMGVGKYFNIFYALCRGINFYEGDFLAEVCAYSDYTGPPIEPVGGWEFYKEKK